MKLLTLICSLVVVAGPAWGGVRVGNAAHVMICKDQPNVVLLDLWEAKVKRHLTLSSFRGLDAPQIVDAVLSRLGERFPMLAREIGEEYRFYNAPGNNTPKAGRFPALPHYADNLPSECEDPVVSAFQRDPVTDGDTLYNYSAELRARTDEFTFAAQAYHEVAYQIGIRHGLDHPLGIREQTGLVFSDEALSAPDQAWVNALLNSFVDLYQIRGQWVPLFDEPLKSCDPSPRRANSCPGVMPSQAALVFDAAKALKSITYNQPRVIPLGDEIEHAVTAIETSRVEVIQREDLQALKFQGRVLPIRATAGAQPVPFKGYYVLNTHLLCGRIYRQRTATCRPADEFFRAGLQVRADK